jgi:DNA-binding protein HU-beta
MHHTANSTNNPISLSRINLVYCLRLIPQPNHLKGLTMNRSELIAAMAEKTNSTKVDADKAIAALIDIITATLKKGDNVALVGFGTFEVRKRAARAGRNPSTGEAIKIKASKAPAFKAGATLKAVVNGTAVAKKAAAKPKKKVGPNDPCTCGSGAKYKNCCGAGK